MQMAHEVPQKEGVEATKKESSAPAVCREDYSTISLEPQQTSLEKHKEEKREKAEREAPRAVSSRPERGKVGKKNQDEPRS